MALEGFVLFDEGDFVLGGGETKILEFFIMPNESGIYSGKFVLLETLAFMKFRLF